MTALGDTESFNIAVAWKDSEIYCPVSIESDGYLVIPIAQDIYFEDGEFPLITTSKLLQVEATVVIAIESTLSDFVNEYEIVVYYQKNLDDSIESILPEQVAAGYDGKEDD